MSKKVRKHKNSCINLSPDGFSVHTFEISRKLTEFEWNHCKDKLYCQQKETGEYWIYPDKRYKENHICKKYSDHGIRVRLEHNKSNVGAESYYVRMVINPRKLTNPDSSYLGILPPNESSIKQLVKAFQKLMTGTPFTADLLHYYLSRIDLCTNIQCEDKRVFRELVRLLRKTNTPKKYQRKFYKHTDKKKANRYNKHYIRIGCGSQELVIYDKTYQLTENDLAVSYEKLPVGVLRVEVHYWRSKIKSIEKKCGSDDPADILWLLMQESKSRICKLVAKCYLEQNYVSYAEGEHQIEQSSFTTATKERMLLLFSEMRRKQTIDAAFVLMERQGYRTNDLLKKFEKLGINPVPLRQGYAAERMLSLPAILHKIEDCPIKVELSYWKWK